MDDTLLKAYHLLDLEPTAPAEEVRLAYRDLVKVWHPDRYQHESERLRRKAEEQMKLITWAYERIAGTPPPEAARQLLAMDFGVRWGYIDPTGATVIEPQFDAAREFIEGLAAVRISDKWGFVNPSGSMPINPLYEDCGDFSEGLAAVKWYGRWGYIDQDGAFVITPRFQEAGQFLGGTAPIRMGARKGRVDKSGAVLFDAFTSGRHLTSAD